MMVLDKFHKISRSKMSRKINRKLSIFEIVHHIDGNPQNNNINNLQIMSREEHSSIHGGVKNKYPKNCKRNRINDYKINMIIKLFIDGKNNLQISKLLKISDQTVRNYLIKYEYIKSKNGDEDAEK